MTLFVHLFVFLWILLGNSSSYSELDRLPTPPVDYRYFADIGQRYKILGTCNGLDNTAPMSRCVVQVIHKYRMKFLVATSPNELIGTGVIIDKFVEHGQSTIVILTSFHIVTAQFDMNFLTFLVVSFSTVCLTATPAFFYYSSIIQRCFCRILCILIVYIILCSTFVYCILLLVYPFLSTSSYQIKLSSISTMNDKSSLSRSGCELITSGLIFSNSWFEDIGKWRNFHSFCTKFNVLDIFI